MVMAVALFTHSDMLEHRPGAGHPERPERLAAVIDALADRRGQSLGTFGMARPGAMLQHVGMGEQGDGHHHAA